MMRYCFHDCTAAVGLHAAYGTLSGLSKSITVAPLGRRSRERLGMLTFEIVGE